MLYKLARTNSRSAKIIAQLKAEGREREISDTVRQLKKAETDIISKDLAYASNELFNDYIHDMKIIQRFAVLNRKAMTEVILRGRRSCAESKNS